MRRIEYPPAAFAPEMAQDESVEDVQLTAEFRGATFVRQISRDIFAFDVPPQAKRVTKFVPPPRALPSGSVWHDGRSVWLRRPDRRHGLPANRWGTASRCWCGSITTPRVSRTYGNCHGSTSNTRRKTAWRSWPCVSSRRRCRTRQIADLTRLWQADLPTVRDVQACGRDLFQVPWAPTLVVLDGKNVVQIFEVGANPDLASRTPPGARTPVGG